MSLNELEKRRTFDLAREFIKVRRALDRLIRSKRWTLLRRLRIDRLRRRSAELAGELAERYHGLFLQIFNGLRSRGHSTTFTFERFLETWWEFVEQPIMGAVSEEEVSHVFWSAAEFASNAVFGTPVSAIQGLRPKFMLRPLVDHIRDSAKRSALLSMTYDARASSAIDHYSPEQQYRIGVAACEALFDAVSAVDDLDDLTNGAIHDLLLNDRRIGSDQLRSWLFGTW